MSEYLDIGGIPHKIEDDQLYKLVDVVDVEAQEEAERKYGECVSRIAKQWSDQWAEYRKLPLFERLNTPKPDLYYQTPDYPGPITVKAWRKVEEND